MITGLSLSEFRQQVSDLARPNRFEVEIVAPKIYTETPKIVSWLAETAQIPSRSQSEIKIKYHGMSLDIPGDYGKEPLTIGFINSYGWEGRNFFDIWMEKIQYVASDNIRESAFDIINDSTIVISQLGRTKSSTIGKYKFYNVYPNNISTIDLDMGQNDAYEKFTVAFSYSHYEYIVGNVS